MDVVVGFTVVEFDCTKVPLIGFTVVVVEVVVVAIVLLSRFLLFLGFKSGGRLLVLLGAEEMSEFG